MVLILGKFPSYCPYNQDSPSVIISGEAIQVHCLNPRVIDGVLQLGHYGRCQILGVRIAMGQLDRVVFEGNGDLNINNVHSTELTITKIGNGNLTVRGNDIGLTNLMVRGAGDINIPNINSASLYLDIINDGNIDLQGKMNLELFTLFWFRYIKYQ